MSKKPIIFYPFGMVMPERTFSSPIYRYGFNGKEKTDEISGEGNELDFGARIYDSRLGKWMSLDPFMKKYSGLSPFNFCNNNAILYLDPDGQVIQFYGDVTEFNKASALVNNKLAGSGLTFTVGSNGIAAFSGPIDKLSIQQTALYNSLNTVITSEKTTNVYAVPESQRSSVLGGSWSGNPSTVAGEKQNITVGGVKINAQFIDVKDLEALDANKSDGISGVSALAHEIFEGYMYQDQGKTTYDECHNPALVVQGNIDGYRNVTQTASASADVMNVEYTTYNSAVKNTAVPIKNNNLKGTTTDTTVKKAPLPLWKEPTTMPVDQVAPRR